MENFTKFSLDCFSIFLKLFYVIDFKAKSTSQGLFYD